MTKPGVFLNRCRRTSTISRYFDGRLSVVGVAIVAAELITRLLKRRGHCILDALCSHFRCVGLRAWPGMWRSPLALWPLFTGAPRS